MIAQVVFNVFFSAHFPYDLNLWNRPPVFPVY